MGTCDCVGSILSQSENKMVESRNIKRGMKPNQTIIDLAKSYGFDGAELEAENNE